MFNKKEKYIGYWFAGNSSNFELKTGQKIKNAKAGPPYMVVDEQIETVLVTEESWPGSLWRAQVIKLGDMSNTVPNIWYRRAREIELIEELPIGMLFGVNGDKIASLLNQIIVLDSLTVDALHANSADKSATEAAYARAWEHWNINLKHPRSHTYDNGLTLGSPSRHDKQMSPTNYGFSLISGLTNKRARELDGDAAFVEDDYYGEIELVLNPRWNAACRAFMYKAMALSMAQYLAHADVEILAQSWTSVFGKDG